MFAADPFDPKMREGWDETSLALLVEITCHLLINQPSLPPSLRSLLPLLRRHLRRRCTPEEFSRLTSISADDTAVPYP